jgi:hypothetical protein
MLRNFFEKRRLRKVFSRVITPEAIEAIFTGEGLDVGLREGPLQFVLPYVRGTPTEISDRVGTIAEVAKVHSAVFYTALGPLAAVAFGTQAWSPPDAAKRRAFVEDLRQKLREDVKIIHGAAIGHHGLLGEKTAVLSYTFILPQFDRILAALARLDFGAAEEFVE